MLSVLFILFLQLSSAATWKTGKFTIELFPDKRGNHVTKACLSPCPIDEAAEKELKANPLTSSELIGGKNPGSVICQRIKGSIIYLEHNETVEASCHWGKDYVALPRLNEQLLPK